MAGSSGAVYTGELDANGKWSGFGRLEYADGLVYEGMFADGQYHGEGRLTLPGGAHYSAHWERGLELPASGAVHFADGLVFNPAQGLPEGAPVAAAPDGSPRRIGAEWGYMSGSLPGGHDRRTWAEHQAGARAALQPRLSPAKVQHGESLGARQRGEEAAAAARLREGARGGGGGRLGEGAWEGAAAGEEGEGAEGSRSQGPK
jgi:hypothetical protein